MELVVVQSPFPLAALQNFHLQLWIKIWTFKINYNLIQWKEKRIIRYSFYYFQLIYSMKKTGNLIIRQGVRKSSRQNICSLNSNTSLSSKNDLKQNRAQCRPEKKKQQKRNSQLKQSNDLHKQMMMAENLNEKQQIQIQHEAKKTVNKKVKKSEKNIQDDMIAMLEQECNKLGTQLQKQKMKNQSLKFELERMRQNICSLNMKLQKIYEDNNCLSKHQSDGKIQNKQLNIQLNRLKTELQKRNDEIEVLKIQKSNLQERTSGECKYLNQNINKLNKQILTLKQSKNYLQKQLGQKTNQVEELLQTLQQKRIQWQAEQKQLESHVKVNLQKKGEKITKYQSDSIKLQQKLREQEVLRKKLHERNKQLQKEAYNLGESKKQLQDLIVNLKKRINDLSILKSSNTTIMNQKIAVLSEENQKLKAIIQLKGIKREIQKPVLFGSQEFND